MAPRAASLLLCLLGSLALASAQQVKCPPPNFDSVKNLNMTAYMSKTWFVNMQVCVRVFRELRRARSTCSWLLSRALVARYGFDGF
jgi:hypothetical protein